MDAIEFRLFRYQIRRLSGQIDGCPRRPADGHASAEGKEGR
jgi:hypothetical protein